MKPSSARDIIKPFADGLRYQIWNRLRIIILSFPSHHDQVETLVEYLIAFAGSRHSAFPGLFAGDLQRFERSARACDECA